MIDEFAVLPLNKSGVTVDSSPISPVPVPSHLFWGTPSARLTTPEILLSFSFYPS